MVRSESSDVVASILVALASEVFADLISELTLLQMGRTDVLNGLVILESGRSGEGKTVDQHNQQSEDTKDYGKLFILLSINVESYHNRLA